MRAVVLVGGFGTRLRPLTNEVPKPMLPIGHVPMIVRLIQRLERGGVDRVTLALGFKPEPFRGAFPGDRCGDVAVEYAVEPEPLDTGGAIRFAAEASGIDETCVVANGDVLTDLDVAEMVQFHRARGAEATVHCTPVEDPSAYGVAELGDTGQVLRFVEKPAAGTEPSNLINAGTYIVEPSLLERIPLGERVSIERDTFPAAVADGAVFAMATDDYWIDAGRPDLYLQANLDVIGGHRRHDRAEAVAPRADVAPGARVTSSLIAQGATVGAGAEISESVVLPGANIGAGAVVIRSIVMGTMGADSRAERSVLGADGVIEAHDRVLDERRPDPEQSAER